VQEHLASLIEVARAVLSSVDVCLGAVHGTCELVLQLNHSLEVLLTMQVDVDLVKSLERLLSRLESLVPLHHTRRQVQL
jgi:hypothetical protein